MQIKVQHMEFDDITGNPMGFVDVALVDVSELAENSRMDQLEYAYRYTNNIDGSWAMKIGSDANNNVTVLAELPVSKRTGQTMGLRSTMMGDRMIVNGVIYKVAAFGFEMVQ